MPQNINFHRHVDELEKFTSMFLKAVFLPRKQLYSLKSADIKAELERVFRRCIDESLDFCREIDRELDGLPSVVDLSVKYASGSFGSVGPLTLQNSKCKSFKIFPIPKISVPGVMLEDEVIVKVSNEKRALNIFVDMTNIKSVDSIIISFEDPFSEIIFSGLVSYMVDTGFVYGVSKSYASYVCEYPGPVYSIQTISEKNDTSLMNILLKNVVKDKMTFSDIFNMLIQFMYSLYVLKETVGFVHFDTHPGNIMMKKIQTPSSNEGANFIYNGKSLKKYKFLGYYIGKDAYSKHNILVVKNSGLLVKIIDFGLCMACPTKTKLFRNRLGKEYPDIYFATKIPENIAGGIAAQKNSILSSSYFNTVDVLYTLLNVYLILKYNPPSFTDIPEYKNIADGLEQFLQFLTFSGGNAFDIIKNKRFDKLYSKAGLNGRNGRVILDDRDVGIFDENGIGAAYFMEKTMNFLLDTNRGKLLSIDNSNIIYLVDEYDAMDAPHSFDEIFISHPMFSYQLYEHVDTKLDFIFRNLPEKILACEADTLKCSELTSRFSKVSPENFIGETLFRFDAREPAKQLWARPSTKIFSNEFIDAHRFIFEKEVLESIGITEPQRIRMDVVRISDVSQMSLKSKRADAFSLDCGLVYRNKITGEREYYGKYTDTSSNVNMVFKNPTVPSNVMARNISTKMFGVIPYDQLQNYEYDLAVTVGDSLGRESKTKDMCVIFFTKKMGLFFVVLDDIINSSAFFELVNYNFAGEIASDIYSWSPGRRLVAILGNRYISAAGMENRDIVLYI